MQTINNSTRSVNVDKQIKRAQLNELQRKTRRRILRRQTGLISLANKSFEGEFKRA